MNKVCKALLNEGLSDPNSQKTIDFCTGKCPYSYCVVVEEAPPPDELILDKVKHLSNQGMAAKEIALKLHIHKRVVYRYLRNQKDTRGRNHE